MIIGGVAASLLGKPRFTADVDVVALIEDKKLPSLLKAAKRLGFETRIKDAVGFAQKNRVLLLKHTKTGINVDLSLGLLPFEIEAIGRSKRFKIANITFNLPTPEDLIIFKAVAHRPKDIEDIREIVKIHARVNKTFIKKTIIEFARALEMPELWEDIKTKQANLMMLGNIANYIIDLERQKIAKGKLSMEDQWILSRYNSTLRKVTELYDEYRIDEVIGEIERLFVQLSKDYIKLVRDRAGSDSAVLETLREVYLGILKMFSTICNHLN